MLRALVLTSVILLVSAHVADATKPSACQSLKGRDLARAASIKLVVRDNDQLGEDLIGCRLPSGKVRILARTTGEDTYQPSLMVQKVAGRWVSVELSYYGGMGIEEDSTSTENVIADAATGRRYAVAGTRRCRRSLRDRCTFGPPLRLAINQRGRAVALESRFGLRVVAGYNARGQRTELDEGPPAALPVRDVRLKEDVATWTHSGVALRAPLSERQCKLSGFDRAPAKDVVLVDRAAEGQDGEPGREVVGCVKPAGPRRIVIAGSYSSVAPTEEAVGSWVLASEAFASSSFSFGSTTLVDVRSGRRYLVDSSSCGDQPCSQRRLTALLFNDRGQAVTAEEEGQTTLVAYTSTGTPQRLDSGPSGELPASSLRLTGSRVSWTRNGEAKSFDIVEG